MEPLALDIETTGLDPETDSVVAVGIARPGDVQAIRSDDEVELLHWVESVMSVGPPSGLVVTWNGEEFDLPFLAQRFRDRGVPTKLSAVPRAELGKYGKPLHTCTWAGLEHLDLAPIYREAAKQHGVPWSLKPVAEAVLGVMPVEVDRRGSAIAQMPEDALLEYLRSDISITLALYEKLSKRRIAGSA